MNIECPIMNNELQRLILPQRTTEHSDFQIPDTGYWILDAAFF